MGWSMFPLKVLQKLQQVVVTVKMQLMMVNILFMCDRKIYFVVIDIYLMKKQL